MIDLLLGILFFGVILILFKLFDRYKVDNLQAIVVNYLVAGSLGILLFESSISFSELLQADWIYYSVLIGTFFIVVFNLFARASQKVGLALSTVANKMSVLLPVIASFFLYGDTVSFSKILGIIVAIIGVLLSSVEKGKLSFDPKYLGLILVIFFGQGIADILFNFAQSQYVEQAYAPLYIAVIFLSAFFIGIILLLFQIFQQKQTFKWRNVLWGIALGIPNYLTIFFFFRALENGFMESSQVYPILNMGVIVISALAGLLFFKEKLSLLNWMGIGLCIVSIALISL